MSENNALTVNVWTPAADNRKRAVMVWISCGAFTYSNGGDPVTEGTNLAREHDVVIVTFNCRPGLLGFLYLGDVLGGEYEAGNAGLLDQIAALRWVQGNISGFGGDPGNVTIFGCSGSGFSCAALMSMPLAQGLFQRAIIQSGSDFACNTREHSSAYTRALLRHLGIEHDPLLLLDVPAAILCAAKEALVDTPIEAGQSSTRGGPGPCVDEVTLPAQPLVAWTAGSAANIDLLIGSNQEEMNIRLPPGASPGAMKGILPRDVANVDDFVRILAASCDGLNGDLGGKLRAQWLIEGYLELQSERSLSDVVNFIRSDLLFRIPASRMAVAQISGSSRSVYTYLFNWGAASHGLEIPFVFDNLAFGMGGRSMEQLPGAQALASQMSQAWTSFARTGDPGRGWMPCSIDQRETMIWGDNPGMRDDPFGAERRLWDGVPIGNRTLLASQLPDLP